VIVSQIKTGVYRYGFDSTDPVLDWINEALTYFVDAFNWPWLYTEIGGNLNIGASFLSLPADFLTPQAIQIADPGATFGPYDYLRLDSRLGYIEDGFNDNNRGRPCAWTHAEGKMWFDIAPDLAYNYILYYQKFAPVLLFDSDTPGIPTRYHYALVRGAAAVGLDAENQEERANTQLQRFQDIIDRAITKYTIGSGTRFGTVRNVRN